MRTFLLLAAFVAVASSTVVRRDAPAAAGSDIDVQKFFNELKNVGAGKVEAAVNQTIAILNKSLEGMKDLKINEEVNRMMDNIKNDSTVNNTMAQIEKLIANAKENSQLKEALQKWNEQSSEFLKGITGGH